jgi:hypothetical protein
VEVSHRFGRGIECIKGRGTFDKATRGMNEFYSRMRVPGWLHGYKAQREHKKPDREAGDYCEDEASTNDFRTMMVRKEQYQREDRWQI